ncbi:hypothetical protein SLA2020_389200 [Shorea laevis]
MVEMINSGGYFTNQLLQKGPQDISHLFDTNSTTDGRSTVEISSTGNNTTTLDLLGIGGSTSRPVNLHDTSSSAGAAATTRLELEAMIEPAKVANYESFPGTTHTWGFRNI